MLGGKLFNACTRTLGRPDHRTACCAISARWLRCMRMTEKIPRGEGRRICRRVSPGEASMATKVCRDLTSDIMTKTMRVNRSTFSRVSRSWSLIDTTLEVGKCGLGLTGSIASISLCPIGSVAQQGPHVFRGRESKYGSLRRTNSRNQAAARRIT